METVYTTPRVDLQNIWSDPAGNIRAPWREISLHRSLQMFAPLGPDGRPIPGRGESRFYFAPGERACKNYRRSFADHKAYINDPSKKAPSRIEIEFSSPSWHIPSVPKAYRTSAIDWALRQCDAVLVCVDREWGTALGEAHAVLAPVQVVFRSREEHVPEWIEFLTPRLRGRHRLSVVHIAAGRA